MTSTPLKIEKVKTIGESKLSIAWENGTSDTVDLSGWIKLNGEILHALNRPEIFATAEVAFANTSVQWADDDDLVIDNRNLARIAAFQRPAEPGFIIHWQKKLDLSNNESADFVGVSISTWNNYRAGAIPPQALVTVCRIALEDPVLVYALLKPRKAGRPAREAV